MFRDILQDNPSNLMVFQPCFPLQISQQHQSVAIITMFHEQSPCSDGFPKVSPGKSPFSHGFHRVFPWFDRPNFSRPNLWRLGRAKPEEPTWNKPSNHSKLTHRATCSVAKTWGGDQQVKVAKVGAGSCYQFFWLVVA